MLVLAQRWVIGILGGEQFGRDIVEALIIARTTPSDGPNWELFSAFYDPAQGETVQTAFKWWRRGSAGMLPSLALSAQDILSHWALPPQETTDLKTYIMRMEVFSADIQKHITQKA